MSTYTFHCKHMLIIFPVSKGFKKNNRIRVFSKTDPGRSGQITGQRAGAPKQGRRGCSPQTNKLG